MNPMLNIARQAALNAGDIIVRNINRLQRMQITKKGRNDYVTEVDRLAEQEIIGTIRHSYPDHAFLAEESGQTGESDLVWIIDPLDGTTNYLHGFPVFAVSIALQINGRLECGLIYDVMRQEIFEASRGQGAKVDGHRIRVSKQAGLQGALIGTGFPFRNNNRWLDEYMEMLKAVIKSASGIRRPGAAALDLAYVAAGRLDGFWETGLSPWDMAAGTLIIREAGGFVTDFSGGENFLESGNIIAGNPKVYKELMKTIHPHLGALGAL
ncbi:MAG: inositol monophosphatase [Proteobacteria bacterium]|nr:inositol monophosphatase [Pseudomonadota bacterium]